MLGEAQFYESLRHVSGYGPNISSSDLNALRNAHAVTQDFNFNIRCEMVGLSSQSQLSARNQPRQPCERDKKERSHQPSMNKAGLSRHPRAQKRGKELCGIIPY
jgi:hypothetical protein